jgi:transglutaminase-like putative cysteine protease
MVALCRACGLPAKYVSGQLAGEGGTHAWVEVLLVEEGSSTAEILAVDPTLDKVVDLRYLTVAVGRDYRDVMPTSGFYTGKPANMLSHIRVLEVISVRMQSQRHRATA